MTEGRKAARLDLSEEVLTLDEDLKEYSGVREKVLRRAQKMGIEPAPMPRRNGRSMLPEMPENPASIPNHEVTNKRGEIITIYSYAVEMRAIADLTAEALEEEVKTIHAALFLKAKGTVEERKAKVLTNEQYRQAKSKQLEWKGLSSLLRARCDTLDKADKLLSRDVEFRKLESEKYRRDSNVNRMKRKMDRVFHGDD